MVDRKYRATFWRPFPVAIYVTSFIEEFFGRLSHILRPRRVFHDISNCCMACHLSTDLQNHQDSKICSVFCYWNDTYICMFCQRAYRCCSAVNDLLVTSYFIPCIRGAKKSMVNQIPEYTNFFHTNKNSLYLLRNRGKEIVLPTSCTSYDHLACSGLSTIRVSYRSRQGTRPCQRLPL